MTCPLIAHQPTQGNKMTDLNARRDASMNMSDEDPVNPVKCIKTNVITLKEQTQCKLFQLPTGLAIQCLTTGGKDLVATVSLRCLKAKTKRNVRS